MSEPRLQRTDACRGQARRTTPAKRSVPPRMATAISPGPFGRDRDSDSPGPTKQLVGVGAWVGFLGITHQTRSDGLSASRSGWRADRYVPQATLPRATTHWHRLACQLRNALVVRVVMQNGEPGRFGTGREQ